MNVPQYRRKRHLTQMAGLMLLVLIPAAGIFRIDLGTASLMLLGRPVPLSNFFVVCGLAMLAASAPLLTYSTIGTLWCGWMCPQNTVSEWANALTHRLLGSRANVNVESAGLQVAPSKNRLKNWAALVFIVALTSIVLGVIPLFYFFPPKVVWSLVSFQEDSQFSRFMHGLYGVGMAAVLLDIAVFRYFWCSYLCLYRFGQLLFKTDDALHVRYDAARSGDCAKCNLCRTSCITGIDPTAFKFFDRCINCGECIDACNRLHGKKSRPGLLRFAFGAQAGAPGRLAALRMRVGRFGWPGIVVLAGCAFLFWGITQV